MRSLILAAALSAAAPSPQGTWVSDGYGLVFQIDGDSLESWEVTKVSCLPSMKASAVATPEGALGAFRETGDPTTILLLRDSEPDRMRLHRRWAASDIVLRRAEGKPVVCQTKVKSGPLADFDVFAETWTEQYAFFSLKKADWPAIVARSRSKVKDRTSPEELFDILEGMVAPFEDAHTFIGSESPKRRFSGARKSASWIDWGEKERAYALVTKYLVEPLDSLCEGQVELGMLRPDIGYLRLRSFSGYHSDESFESGLAALDAALDDFFASAGSWKGLVIDVRINTGGADPYGLAIASRLTDKEYIAYAKQARNDPADSSRWTAEQPSIVAPSKRPGFHGPVVELIGIQSVSAAETFTQALLHRRPAVVRMGENTQGVFSDVLARSLPNGWRFGLPNERFVTDGRAYDGAGIAPDVPVESFTPEGLASGRDAGIEAALDCLAPK